MRRLLRTTVLAASLLPTLLAWPARAGGATNVTCTFELVTHFSPGFTLTETSGTDQSAGESGFIDCTGTIKGNRVTGRGSAGNAGVYTATCFVDRGSGRYFFTVPTNGGPLRVEGTYTYERVGLVLVGNLVQPDARGHMTLVVVPTKGDCLTTPITEALAKGVAVLNG